MNFALPTLIILCLLLPGFAFRKAYYSGYFSNQYLKSDFTRLIFSVLIPSAVLHIIGNWIFQKSYQVDIEAIGKLLSGNFQSEEVGKLFNIIYENSSSIIYYIFLLTFLGAFLGWLFKLLVRNLKLDRKLEVFRYKNEWHYLFSGEILDFPEVNGKSAEKNLTHIDALVDTAEGTYLYVGILDKYNLGANGGLNNIYLTNCKRKKIDSNEYYKMPGNYVVIPNSEIKNLHITYYSIIINQA